MQPTFSTSFQPATSSFQPTRFAPTGTAPPPAAPPPAAPYSEMEAQYRKSTTWPAGSPCHAPSSPRSWRGRSCRRQRPAARLEDATLGRPLLQPPVESAAPRLAWPAGGGGGCSTAAAAHAAGTFRVEQAHGRHQVEPARAAHCACGASQVQASMSQGEAASFSAAWRPAGTRAEGRAAKNRGP